MDYEVIKREAEKVCLEFLEKANIPKGGILIIGCSSSEIMGENIGKGSDFNGAKAVYDAVAPILADRGIFLAAQCCEHLNRAVILERAALPPWAEVVNVVPQPKAGGSFATTVYQGCKEPAAVENIACHGGIDIGDTLIGMHLKDVAVPVRIPTKSIGKAHVVCARTRPKFIGGSRAIYDEKLSGGDVARQ